MRAARGAMTPLDAVLAWPWHKTIAVHAEAVDIHDETWGHLLRVWYRFDE